MSLPAKTSAFCLFGAFSLALLGGALRLSATATSERALAPDAPEIEYSDCANVTTTAEAARFDRGLKINPGQIGEHDNPGARIRFSTDAKTLTARLWTNDVQTPQQYIKSTGEILVDDQMVGSFQSPTTRPSETLVPLPSPADGKAHLYELVLPYGDSVEFRGLTVDAKAHFQKPAPRPALRWVAYGDSITHGYQASDVGGSYPFRIGQKKHWQVINMGFGGRQATASDGTLVAALHPDFVTVLIGVNDCNAGKPLDQFKADVAGFLQNLRAGKSGEVAPVYVITPLSAVAGAFNNAEAKLPPYRAAIRAAVEERADPKIHLIEGPQLLPSDARYYGDGVHPNDEGFRIFSDNLAALLPNARPLAVK